MKFESQKGYFL